MTYTFDLETGRQVHLENRGKQTLVSVYNDAVGQQRTSSSFYSGQWISSPEINKTYDGVEIKITTAHGKHNIQIQGNSIAVNSRTSASGYSQQTLSSSSISSRKATRSRDNKL
jgi:hypothetical protein